MQEGVTSVIFRFYPRIFVQLPQIISVRKGGVWCGDFAAVPGEWKPDVLVSTSQCSIRFVSDTN
jgi:hypothetical protein